MASLDWSQCTAVESKAYEVLRLATDEGHKKYKKYQFSDQSWSKQHRGLPPDQQLHVLKLRQESPLELVAITTAVTAGVGALWALVQIVEKVSNWPLNRDLLRLQRDKLRHERSKNQISSPDEIVPDIDQIIEVRQAEFIVEDVCW